MFQRTVAVWRTFGFLALFGALAVIGACGSASTDAEQTEASMGDEDARFSPWEKSLALSSPFPRFIFLPLNNPGVVPVELANHMQDEDIVAGVVVDGKARAYPLWILVAYHVVNDTIGEAPVLLAHCEICSGASAFKPVLEGFEGRTLSFQIHGIAKGTFSIYDYQTQTVWSPFTGRTFDGKLHPSRMNRVPLVLEPWEDWVKRYPETDVVFASRKFEEREHGRGEHNQIGAEYLPDGFKEVANMDDTRLNANVLIFGVTNLAGDQSIAFPLDLLEGQEVMTYEFADESYLLKKINAFTVVAFRLQGDQEDRTYQQVSQGPFRLADDQGGLWDEFGNAVNETGEKQNLAAADGYMTEWYEWVSGYPESQIAR
jgi:hypothetical protein